MPTQTATTLESDQTVEKKIQRLRELYSGCSSFTLMRRR